MAKNDSVYLYEREVVFYLEKIKKLSLVLRKKVIIANKDHSYDFLFYLIKENCLYYALSLDIGKSNSIKSKRRLFIYKRFHPEKDPIQALISFRELGSVKFFKKHMPLGNFKIHSTKYTSYSGKYDI